MLPWHSYLIYCGLYALMIAVPGPGIVSIVARALGQGFRATIPAVVGTAVGDCVLMSLAVFGLAAVAKAMGGAFLAVKLSGAAYLVYLGYKYWTAPVEEMTDIVPAGAGRGFLSQFALTLGNPKAIAFFVALLPAAVNVNTIGVFGYLQLLAATLVLIPAIELLYAALAARVRGVLTGIRARRRINKTAAVVMVGAAVGVTVSG